MKGKIIMEDTGARLSEIKKKLARLPGHKLEEINDFIEFLLSKDRSRERRIVQMKGVWAGKGFEKLDLRREIKNGRQELLESISKRSL
ncbi:MAG: hypothetical protein JRJ29_21910 [Deltaproteobacteria bacterium]|nr:hypothetical protein [Deltaproteobacteria bacterium]